MKDTGPFKLFTGQQSHKELVGLLEKEETRRISVNGLFGSSKSVVMADTFNEGINVVVMDNKEEAQFITNDLYNIMEEDCVFFFPCSSNISQSKINTIKDSSQKVQRSAAISFINAFVNGESKVKSAVLIAYPASIYEKIPNKSLLKKNILKVRKVERDPISSLRKLWLNIISRKLIL